MLYVIMLLYTYDPVLYCILIRSIKPLVNTNYISDTSLFMQLFLVGYNDTCDCGTESVNILGKINHVVSCQS